MKCPHCLHQVTPSIDKHSIAKDIKGDWFIRNYICLNEQCQRIVMYLLCGEIYGYSGGWGIDKIKSETLIYPRSSSRTSISAELIPEQIFKDYTESANVLSISPKASAALSRRCLQNLIQNYAGIKGKSLDDEITQLISTGKLPTYITASIDAIRNIGNFAAHPKKSQQSGEIVEVETGEAEWTLDVLESLFDFYFIQPSIINEKKDALNKKLNDLGKPKMK